MGNTQRIIFNAGALYSKIVINTVLMLLSTRYTLSALGIIDFGLYFVIAGVMVFMGFITSAMATSSQRHLSYELGRGDSSQLCRVFNTCFGLHLVLAIVIIILGETLGLWFLNNVLNIPELRQKAAFWVFQFTVFTSTSYVLAVPYLALLTAYEALGLVSIISIIQSVLNFILALCLSSYTGDRLIIYGLFTCTIAVAINIAFVVLSNIRYSEESQLIRKHFFDATIVKELASFSGWSLFGSASVVARSQGLTFLLNIFFGPLANASFGIANQVQGAISQFTQAILQVVSPCLVKHEGLGNRDHMIDLALLISKYSFFFGCLWAIPFIAEMTTILHLWLNNPPEHAALFCRIILLIYLCNQLSNGLTIPFQAIGKIGKSQVIGGLIHLSTLPLAYIMIRLGGSDIVVLIASLITICINTFARGYLLKSITVFSYVRWLKAVVFRGTLAMLPPILVTCFLLFNIDSSPVRLLVITPISLSVSIVSMVYLGMEYDERHRLYGLLSLSSLRAIFKVNG